MNKRAVIENTANHVRQQFEHESTGHDWHHIDRVWQMAKKIGRKEKANQFVVELAALLHDIADWKFHDDELAGAKAARAWLKQFSLEPEIVDHVCDIVAHISFKGLDEENKIKTLEGRIVQDADRLDAIGAIAIARVFAYGGAKGRPIYNPSIPVENYKLTPGEYRRGSATGIHHFYDKLLHLKDRLHTSTARKIGQRQHKYMERYLAQFFREWAGK